MSKLGYWQGFSCPQNYLRNLLPLTSVPTMLCMSYQALLFCPDDKTARVVTQVLNDLDFTVEPCNEPFAAVKRLMAQHFDAIVVDCDNEQNAALLFKSARNSSSNQTSLAVAVVEGQAGVAKAFRIGANLVLTKPINVEQSKGTLRVARGLLRKTEAGRSAASTLPTAAAPPRPPAPPAPVAPVVPPKPAFAPPSVPLASAAKPAPAVVPPSALEIEEEEAVLEPDAEDAAVLESLPEPPPTVRPSHPVPPPAAKEYPWQPVSKSQSEPMASAIKRAAEVAGESEPHAPEAAASAAPPAKPATGSLKLSLGRPPKFKEAPASTVPAEPKDSGVPPSAPPLTLERPAKPAKRSTPPLSISKVSITEPSAEESPLAASEPSPAAVAPAPAGKKKIGIVVLLVLVVVLAAAAGYFGWTTWRARQAAHTPQPQATFSQVPAPSQVPTPQVPQPAAAPETSSVPAPPATSLSSPAGQKPSPSLNSKPSSTSKTTEPAAQAHTKPAEVEEESASSSPEPVVVKHVAPKSAKPAAEPAELPVAGALVAANSDNKTIAGIVGSTSVSIPKGPGQTLKVSQGISQGLLIKRVQPIYPSQAIQMRLQGAVTLQATISKEGNITSVKQLNGNPTLGRAAMNAVREWKYKPYLLNGQPIEIETQVVVNFQLP